MVEKGSDVVTTMPVLNEKAHLVPETASRSTIGSAPLETITAYREVEVAWNSITALRAPLSAPNRPGVYAFERTALIVTDVPEAPTPSPTSPLPSTCGWR